MAKRHQVGIEIKTTGDPKGARITEDALEEVEEAARKVRQELDKIDGIDPVVKKQIQGVADSMDRAAVSGRKLAAAKNQTATSSRNSGLAVLEFSRAVEDAQYGIRGVLNNIPQLVLLMGGGGGLAGVISLAAVGLSTLFSALGSTEEKLGDTKEETSELVDKFRQLEDAANQARYESFVASLDEINNKLEVQNTAFKNSIELMSLHQEQALKVAAAQANLERARIAQRVITDPNFTKEDAAQELEFLRIQEIQLEGAKEIAAVQKKKILASRKVAELEARIAAEQEAQFRNAKRDRALRERISQLEAQQGTQQFLQGQRDSAIANQSEQDGFINTMLRGAANAMATNREDLSKRTDFMRSAPDQDFIDQTFTDRDRGELEALKAAVKRGNDWFKGSADLMRGLRNDLEIAQDGAENIAEAAEAATQNTEIVTDIKVKTKEVEGQTRRQKEALKEADGLLLDIAKDGILDSQERQEATALLQKFNQDSTLANSATAEVLRRLVTEAQTTAREMSALRETVKAIQASRGR